MSAWAGIESRPAPAIDTRPVASTHVAGRSPAPARRPLRRHERPVIGSLDNGGSLVQRHAREVLIGSAFIVVPGVALTLLATTMAFDRYQSFKDSVISVPELLGGQRADTGVEELLVYLGLLLSSLGAAIVGGFIATLVVQRQLGGRPTIRAGYRALGGRLPALVAAWVVGHCWIPLAGLSLANVRGDGWVPFALFGVPAALVLAAFTALVSPAIVVERLGPFAGLRRSMSLARRNFSLLFAFVFVSALIGLVVQYGIAYLPRLLQRTGLVSFGRFGWLIEGAAGQLGRLISIPLVAAATAYVYLELRMTTEGMDLVLDADRAFGQAA